MTAFADLGRYKTPWIDTPSAETILTDIRRGQTYANLGIIYGCSESTLRRRVQDSGLVAPRQRHALPLLVAREAPAWMDDGLCAQTDPEAFFPEVGRSPKQARSVCGKCDVRTECLTYALDHDERFGIWAGLTPGERRKLKKEKP